MYLIYSKGGANRQYTYISLVENVRDENGKTGRKTIKKYGRMDKLLEKDPHAVEKIQAELEAIKKAQYEADSIRLVEELHRYLDEVSKGVKGMFSKEDPQSLPEKKG